LYQTLIMFAHPNQILFSYQNVQKLIKTVTEK
jgi:hypothetical protein